MGQSAAIVDPKDTPSVSPVQAAIEKAKQNQVMDDTNLDDLAALEGHPAVGDDEEDEGEDDKPAPAPDGPKDEDDKPDLKYKDLVAANKAAQEAARKMHKATEEASTLRKQVESLQGEMTQLQQKVVERTAEISEEANEEFLEKILDEMQQLDPLDPGYKKSLAKLYRKMLSQNEKNLQSALATAAKQVVQEELSAKTEEETQRANRLATWEKSNRLAAAAGLDMADTGIDPDTGRPVRSDDFLLFWRTARDAPEEMDEDEKIDWTIKEVNRILGRKVSKKQKQEADARALQNRRVPLGKGAAGPTKGGDQAAQRRTPTLQAALDKARERRKI